MLAAVNVLIGADMEGIAGIDDCGGCLPSHPGAYKRGRRLMTDEVLTVIAALREAGVDDISVGDWHMVGTNIERDRMPAGIEVRPIADLALNEAEPSFEKAHGGALDAVVLIGHHAGTRSPRGFSSHTFTWEMDLLLDGEPLNEVQTYAQGLAAEGLPVLLAAGDRWMLEQLSPGELGSARLVAAKEGESRARARSRDVPEVRAEMAAEIKAALAAPQVPPPARNYPAELVITFNAEEISRTTVPEPAALLTGLATVFRESRMSKEYRQLAGLMPAGHNSVLRGLQRRVGGLLATPVMRAKERRWLAESPKPD
jgi:D-aminopeptidase